MTKKKVFMLGIAVGYAASSLVSLLIINAMFFGLTKQFLV